MTGQSNPIKSAHGKAPGPAGRGGKKAAGSRAARAPRSGRKHAAGKGSFRRKPTSSDGVAKRELILAAALRLFTTRGFHHTPTARISREAGVSTGTLFHYFPDKNTLIDELYLSIQREVAGAVRAGDDPELPTRERLVGCFRGYIAWGVANPGKVAFLNLFYNSPSIGEEVKDRAHREFQWLHDLSRVALREGVLQDIPTEFYWVMIPQVLNGILTLISSGRSTLATDEMLKYGLALILKK